MSLRQHPNHSRATLVGYHEPSAVFLIGTNTILTNPMDAANLLNTDPTQIAAVEKTDWTAFDAAMTANGRKSVRLGEVSGTNYSRGQSVTLIIVKADPGP